MKEILIATGNAHKVGEFCAILPAARFLSLKDLPSSVEIIEDGDTFEANAAKKALTCSKAFPYLTVADDSGLEVDALDGAPGIYSARFAGADATDKQNNEKLISLLKDVAPEKRTARFVCAICVAQGEDVLFTTRGVCEGRLTIELSGKGGFGYDPLFIPTNYTESFADLGEGVKNTISHRGLALAELKTFLETLA